MKKILISLALVALMSAAASAGNEKTAKNTEATKVEAPAASKEAKECCKKEGTDKKTADCCKEKGKAAKGELNKKGNGVTNNKVEQPRKAKTPSK